MIKRWVTTFAFLGAVAAPFSLHVTQGQPPAAVPAWIPPPAPAPPLTLWRFLGIPQGFQRIGDARLNRSGNFPGLERKPPLKPIAHPDNLLSNNPAIKKAAEIKMQEDLAKQKIKAIKYLAKLGCDKCYGGVKEAMLAALDDCTEQVRYEAAKGLAEAAVQHCDVCSRQCCCDEELTKKLAAIVYEMDDKCCPLEPSERVRNMAKEALEACCPNVGPPPAGEIIETPPIEPPPERPPETPPELPPELPPPPGRNGVAPRPNGTIPPRNGELPPADEPPMPNARPEATPESSTQNFLRSRADRAVMTSRGRSMPAVRNTTSRRQVAQGPSMTPQRFGASFVSDEGAETRGSATITIADAARPTAAPAQVRGDGGLRIRSAAKTNLSSTEPNRIWPTRANDTASISTTEKSRPISHSTSEGSVVRIRDSADDLQLASAEEQSGSALKFRPVESASSPTIVSDLFAPPPASAQVASAPKPIAAAARTTRPAQEKVTSVLSVKPKGVTVTSRGRVSGIDSRAGAVYFKFNADQSPAPGTMVKVYHQFLLGEECVGALEVTSVKQGIATARPVGSLNLNKIAPDDQVAFQSSGAATVAANGGGLFAAP